MANGLTSTRLAGPSPSSSNTNPSDGFVPIVNTPPRRCAIWASLSPPPLPFLEEPPVARSSLLLWDDLTLPSLFLRSRSPQHEVGMSCDRSLVSRRFQSLVSRKCSDCPRPRVCSRPFSPPSSFSGIRQSSPLTRTETHARTLRRSHDIPQTQKIRIQNFSPKIQPRTKNQAASQGGREGSAGLPPATCHLSTLIAITLLPYLPARTHTAIKTFNITENKQLQAHRRVVQREDYVHHAATA